MKTNNRIIKLIAKQVTTPLTLKELDELNTWKLSSEINAQLFNRFQDKAYVAKTMRRIWAVDKKAGWKRFKEDHSIIEEDNRLTAIINYIGKYLTRKKVIFFCVIIILLLLTGYCLFQTQQ